MIGIYKITNQINGKVYIGQSIHILRRWEQHKQNVNTGTSKIYQAMRKHGLNNFTFEVLEECSPDQLNDREVYWISYYNSFNSDKGYNMTPGGSEPVKINPQEIYKLWDEGYSVGEIYDYLSEKISYATVKNYLHDYQGWNISESRRRSALLSNQNINKNKTTTIKQYDLFGNFLSNWNSANEASRMLGITSNTICLALNGKQLQAGGFQWRNGLPEDDSLIESIIDKVPCHFEIIQKDLQGNIINRFKTLKEAAQAVNTDSRNIARVCKHERNRKTAKGFIWECDYNTWYDPD